MSRQPEEFLRVVDFDKTQHYKNRNPIWIKLYNDRLDDYAFGRLQDASKAHLIQICLLASRHQNRLPMDAKWIAARIQATTEVNLDELLRLGFIEKIAVIESASAPPEIPASNVLAENAKGACLEREGETEREEEGETEKEKNKADFLSDFDRLWKTFDTALGEKGSRALAEKEYLKLKPGVELFQTLLQALGAQMKYKRSRRAAAQFDPAFQSVDRWLKNRRWEDDLGDQQNLNSDDFGNHDAFMNNHSDRSWADDQAEAF